MLQDEDIRINTFPGYCEPWLKEKNKVTATSSVAELKLTKSTLRLVAQRIEERERESVCVCVCFIITVWFPINTIWLCEKLVGNDHTTNQKY